MFLSFFFSCYFSSIYMFEIILFFLFLAWVDAVWEVEFTERKPLDKTIEEELTARREKSFTALYQCLLAHADQYQSAGSDGASQVSKLVFLAL